MLHIMSWWMQMTTCIQLKAAPLAYLLCKNIYAFKWMPPENAFSEQVVRSGDVRRSSYATAFVLIAKSGTKQSFCAMILWIRSDSFTVRAAEGCCPRTGWVSGGGGSTQQTADSHRDMTGAASKLSCTSMFDPVWQKNKKEKPAVSQLSSIDHLNTTK